MAVLPDFDIFLAPIQKLTGSYYLTHRGASHSYIVSIFTSAIAGGIYSLIIGENFLTLWAFGFFFSCLHITLDLLTTSKIPILYPISKIEYRLVAERAVNPLLMLFSGIYFLLYYYYGNDPEKIMGLVYLANFYSYFYTSYFIYRILTKIWVQLRLPKGQNYIPGIFPFVYIIHENQAINNHYSFFIKKKYQFIQKEKEILKIQLNSGSKELEYYEKARTVAFEYRFFNKWEGIFPKIWEEGNNIIVLLILAESMSRKNAYYLKIIFDKDSGEIISKSNGFDSKKYLE